MKSALLRFAYKLASPMRSFYWFLVRPKTFSVACLLEHEGKYLCIRHTYGFKKERWTIPGGGVKRHEPKKEAVLREVREEVGISLHEKDLQEIGTYVTHKEYSHNTVTCFYAKVHEPSFCIDGVEIGEARWIDKDTLPEEVTHVLAMSLSFAQSMRTS